MLFVYNLFMKFDFSKTNDFGDICITKYEKFAPKCNLLVKMFKSKNLMRISKPHEVSFFVSFPHEILSKNLMSHDMRFSISHENLRKTSWGFKFLMRFLHEVFNFSWDLCMRFSISHMSFSLRSSWGPHEDLMRTSMRTSWGAHEDLMRTSMRTSWGPHENLMRTSWGPHEISSCGKV